MTPRIDPVPADSEDPVLAEVFDRFRAAGREVPLLYRTLGNAPEMLRAWTAMAWPLRTQAVSDRGLRELVIMRVALLTGAAFEWQAHWPAAIGHGVTDEQLGSLAGWRQAGCFSAEARAVLACADEIIVEGAASEGSFADLAAHFGPGECVELVLTAAFYACVSRTLLTLGIEADPADDPTLDVFHRQRV